MPFRLLGVVADPDQASILCGHTFARYAASGVEITLVCASADGWDATCKQALFRLGARDIVLLGYSRTELTRSRLEGALTDVMTSVRPHVVVADGEAIAIMEATAAAFARVRDGGGSSALPAKWYYRISGQATPVAVTTRIAVPDGPLPELFVRVHPSPWVTGVLEGDLFAGVTEEPAEITPRRLAG